MSIKSSQEILSQCLLEDGVLNTKLKSEQEVLNLVYDDTEKALSVAISGLTAANLTNLLTLLSNQATATTLKACVSLADDATISLPACPNGGLLTVDTEAESMAVKIRANGSIEYIRKTANCDTADTDGKLCVYDGGSNAIIKNRLASTKIVTYILEYGTTT